jgi:hypothetical protein
MHLLLEKSGYQLTPLDRNESIDAAAERLVLDIVGPPRLPMGQIVSWFQQRLRKI